MPRDQPRGESKARGRTLRDPEPKPRSAPGAESVLPLGPQSTAPAHPPQDSKGPSPGGTEHGGCTGHDLSLN